MVVNYYVIGGQYASYCYGGCKTLLGAKRIAGKNNEYWDNWAGWHRPDIYAAEDCEEVVNFFGRQIAPKEGAFPVATWDREAREWLEVWRCK